jgi:hypothetical protein
LVCAAFVAPRKDARATRNRTMAAVPPRIALSLLSGFSLPLTVLGAVKRDVFLNYPHVAVEFTPAAQLQLLRSGTNVRRCESAGRAAVGVLERVCLGTVVSPWTKTPGGLDSGYSPSKVTSAFVAHGTVRVRAGCRHSRKRVNSGMSSSSVVESLSPRITGLWRNRRRSQ